MEIIGTNRNDRLLFLVSVTGRAPSCIAEGHKRDVAYLSATGPCSEGPSPLEIGSVEHLGGD